MGYSLYDYGRMIGDSVRVDAYLGAIDALLRPGMTVLDLGTGAGFFAVYAALRGARHVYGIETNDAVELARAIAADNGVADRTTFLRGSSLELDLPERVDLIVSDLRGALPLYGQNLAAVADARARFLAPGGVLLPAYDTLRVALATVPEWYERIMGPWGSDVHGVSMRRGRELVSHDLYSDRAAPVGPEALASAPADVGRVAYGEPPPRSFRGTARLVVEDQVTVHGLLAWFDATIHGEHRFSNAPGSRAIYSRTLLPWPEPCVLAAGATVDVTLSASPSAEDHVWGWTSAIGDAGPSTGQPRIFRQCTLLAAPRMPIASVGRARE